MGNVKRSEQDDEREMGSYSISRERGTQGGGFLLPCALCTVEDDDNHGPPPSIEFKEVLKFQPFVNF